MTKISTTHLGFASPIKNLYQAVFDLCSSTSASEASIIINPKQVLSLTHRNDSHIYVNHLKMTNTMLINHLSQEFEGQFKPVTIILKFIYY